MARSLLFVTVMAALACAASAAPGEFGMEMERDDGRELRDGTSKGVGLSLLSRPQGKQSEAAEASSLSRPRNCPLIARDAEIATSALRIAHRLATLGGK